MVTRRKDRARESKGERERERGRRKLYVRGGTRRVWNERGGRRMGVGEGEKSTTSLRKTTRCATFVHCVGRVQRCVHMRDARDAIGHQDGSGVLRTTHRQNNKHGMRHTRPSVHSFVSISQIPSKIRSPVDTAAGYHRYYLPRVPIALGDQTNSTRSAIRLKHGGCPMSNLRCGLNERTDINPFHSWLFSH